MYTSDEIEQAEVNGSDQSNRCRTALVFHNVAHDTLRANTACATQSNMDGEILVVEDKTSACQ